MLRMAPRAPSAPGSWLSIRRTAAPHTRNRLRAFIASVASQPAAVASCTGPSPMRRPLPPAALKTASRRPKRSTQAPTARSAASSVTRSAASQPAPAPVGSRASASSRQCASVRDTTNTRAPSPARRRAVAAAIPVEPVTRQARSRKRTESGIGGRSSRSSPRMPAPTIDRLRAPRRALATCAPAHSRARSAHDRWTATFPGPPPVGAAARRGRPQPSDRRSAGSSPCPPRR